MSGNENPYWNFWRVVFAGWLIQYPGKFLRAIFWFLLAIAVGVMYIVSPEVDRRETFEDDLRSSIDNTEEMRYNDRDRFYRFK